MGFVVPDAVDLAQRLVRCDTMEGRGERPVLEELAGILRGAGFSCTLEGYSEEHPHKANLYARLNPEASGRSIFFGGHVDTVPPGASPWAKDPLGGEISGGRLHGRGSCDMKGGLAAMLCAAVNMAPRMEGGDLVLHVYGGEETGCRGSFHAARNPEHFGRPGAAIIAEPTGNRLLAGHKGVLWLSFESSGRTAHGSMPEQGVNALAKLLPAACRLLESRPEGAHGILGRSTLALTSLHSGLNINSIPDRAVLTVDLRTVPGQKHADLLRSLAPPAGEEVSMRVLMDVPPVWTDPSTPWYAETRRLLADFSGEEPEIAGAHYFTDAAAVRSLLPELPLLILGPGEQTMAHKTDEYCPLEQIRAAQAIYEAIILAWVRRS
jgi:succinyl-diaminopimelate desuccinylase